MVRVQQQEAPEQEKLVSQFLKEENQNSADTCNMNRRDWRDISVPSCIQIEPLLAKLRQFKQVINEDCDRKVEIDLDESQEIETVRKENVFGEQVTESEQAIIQQRVALQQRIYNEFEKRESIRKIESVKRVYDYLTDEEVITMLQDSSDDEQEVIVRLTEPSYLNTMRKSMALRHAVEAETSRNSMNEEQQANYTQLLQKRSQLLNKTTNGSAKKTYRTNSSRLGLDEALKQMQDSNSANPFEGWSSARIRAHQMIEQNPNSYYYRFNAPGEEQRKGQWSKEERALFHKRLDQIGSNGQWGIFSKEIPGRVGYQCSNFYRLLVETGQIQDPKYVLDDNGKAHYLFDKIKLDGSTEKIIRTHSKHRSGVRAATVGKSTAVTKRKRKFTAWDNEDNEDDDIDLEDYNDDKSGTFKVRSSTYTSRRTRTKAQMEQEKMNENPLPGFIDPITLDEVVKPAISSYGHVMGYDSWVRCLTNWEGKGNICPLTKKRLTKRDLTILTLDNIEAYRDQIIQ